MSIPSNRLRGNPAFGPARWGNRALQGRGSDLFAPNNGLRSAMVCASGEEIVDSVPILSEMHLKSLAHCQSIPM